MMTTKELKEEAIKKAYGEYYDELRMVIEHTHGWCKQNLKKYFGEENIQSKVKKDSLVYRPKSLSGIENNNQWIRIEGDGSNLPKEDGNYYTIYKGDNDFFVNEYFVGHGWDIYNYPISHYQPIIKPEPPVY